MMDFSIICSKKNDNNFRFQIDSLLKMSFIPNRKITTFHHGPAADTFVVDFCVWDVEKIWPGVYTIISLVGDGITYTNYLFGLKNIHILYILILNFKF